MRRPGAVKRFVKISASRSLFVQVKVRAHRNLGSGRRSRARASLQVRQVVPSHSAAQISQIRANAIEVVTMLINFEFSAAGILCGRDSAMSRSDQTAASQDLRRIGCIKGGFDR